MELTLLSVISWMALSASVSLYLSGGLTCMHMIKKKSVGQIPIFPFVATCFSSTIWLKYGFLTNNQTIQIVNSIGCVLQLIYICIYYIYSREKRKLNITLISYVIPLYGALFYAKYLAASETVAANHLGLLGALLSIIMSASPLITLREIIRTKSVATMSFSFVLICCVSCSLWTTFGMLINDVFVMIPNACGVALGIFELFLFVIYPSKKAETEMNGIKKAVLDT